MKVLVLGAQGQVARSLAEARTPQGVEVVAVGRPELDLVQPDTIEQALDAHGPDVVVNAAAYTAVDKAETEPELAHAVNAEGAGAAAEACARKGVPLIHISTDYVFDGRKSGPYVEDDAVAPLGVYGRSKLEGERRVAATSPAHVILRTAWLVSPYGHNFIKTMLRLAATRPEIAVVDDQRGNPTYAPHLATAILAVAERLSRRDGGAARGGIYHATAAGEATWCALAREVFRQSQALGGPSAAVRAITTAEYPTPAARPANSRLDCGKLARGFGVALPEWREGVAACVCALSRDWTSTAMAGAKGGAA